MFNFPDRRGGKEKKIIISLIGEGKAGKSFLYVVSGTVMVPVNIV